MLRIKNVRMNALIIDGFEAIMSRIDILRMNVLIIDVLTMDLSINSSLGGWKEKLT